MCCYASVCKYGLLFSLLSFPLFPSPPLSFPGAESVSPAVLAAVSEQERKKQEAIFELLSSERNYVDSLKLVKEVNVLYSSGAS